MATNTATARREAAAGSEEPEVADLVVRARAGEVPAQRALFDRYQRAVLGYCVLSTKGDRERAMDLSQEAFTRAFRQLHTLADPGNFRGWLFTIVANLCRTRGAAEGRRRLALELFALEQQAAPAPEDPADRERRIAKVQEFLAQVDDARLREIVRLHYVDAVTTREIARRLAIPHGTVTVKLMRFRAAVKRDLCKVLLEEEAT